MQKGQRGERVQGSPVRDDGLQPSGTVPHFVGSALGLWGAAGVPNDNFTYGEASVDVRANLGGYMYEDEDQPAWRSYKKHVCD